jgi:hypothetical protein
VHREAIAQNVQKGPIVSRFGKERCASAARLITWRNSRDADERVFLP